MLSNNGKESAADIYGVPRPSIPEKGTPIKAYPSSLLTMPNT